MNPLQSIITKFQQVKSKWDGTLGNILSPRPEEKKSPEINTNKLLETIRHQESRGENNPYGFSQPSGIKKYGNAMGAYQITGAELDTFGKKFLGNRPSDKDFLNNPKTQDEYMTKKIQFLESKGLDIKDILGAHRGGGSDLSRSARDKINKKFEQYIKEGLDYYNK